jgi:peptidoglycan/LPS O-acetylase OafA/YrhL
MFGTYRTLLAFWVVAAHLGGARMIGEYGVFGFYLLSGYLMTYIMQNNYSYTVSGTLRYISNRLLRIFPAYWASILLTVGLILFLGQEMSLAYHNAMFLPSTPEEILKNVFLVFEHSDLPRLTPPAWALTVEFFYYILIGLGISRYKWMVWVWLTLSIAYHVIGWQMGWSWGERYFPIYAASLPVSVGALMYYYRKEMRKLLSHKNPDIDKYIPLFVLAAVFANWGIGYETASLKKAFFYTNIVLCACMVIVLSTRPLTPWESKKFEKWMGDLSYPIYLTHLQAGMVAYAILAYFGKDYGRVDIVIVMIGVPIILIFGWVFVVTIIRPVDNMRELVKKLKIAKKPQPPG